MARKKKGPRILVKMQSSKNPGVFYWTTKNTRNTTDKLKQSKYDWISREHVEFNEKKA